MKNKIGKLLFLLLLTCGSCSSIYRFSVDIQEPASITLPVFAQNILILNNTVTQPEDNGIERMLDEQSIRADYSLSLDTMVWTAITEIAGVLEESNFFNTVAYYKMPLRMDTEWLAITRLSPEMQSEFYDMEDYDALLVIDRLLFSVNENAKTIKTGAPVTETSVFVDMRTDGIITCSMYSYGKEKPITTFTLSDSLFFKSMITSDSTILFKYFPKYVLTELSYRIGNQVAKRFIPTWKTSERLLFVNYSSRMQEAASYAADKQWTKAEPIWIAELEKKMKPVDKAKITFNLAVANEMRDQFELALEWAQKAKEYLNNTNQTDHHQEIELTDKYISELERRIQNNLLLDLQWGRE